MYKEDNGIRKVIVFLGTIKGNHLRKTPFGGQNKKTLSRN